ncbi:MAG: hypothetical protein IT581_02445 [Verrucomicrobiales bacterium]|nr:hypothetical protein [Verrucomicrobiales bacterium]
MTSPLPSITAMSLGIGPRVLVTVLALAVDRCSPSCASESYQYTFSGGITALQQDDAGLISQAGLSLGSPVEYVYQIDFSSPGYVTHYDGSREILEDLPRPGEVGNLYAHHFSAQLVSGILLRDPEGEATRPPNGWLAGNYGIDLQAAGFKSGSLVTSGVLSYFAISLESADGFFPPLEDPLPWGYARGLVGVGFWKIGDRLRATSRASNPESQSSSFVAELTLRRIDVVPEPGAAALLALGTGLSIAGSHRFRGRATGSRRYF